MPMNVTGFQAGRVAPRAPQACSVVTNGARSDVPYLAFAL
jgi:hypothetical protein